APQFINPALPVTRVFPPAVRHPEQLWGGANLTTQQVLATLSTQFTPGPTSGLRGSGVSPAAIQTAVGNAVPAVIRAIDDWTAQFANNGGPSLQQQQAMSMWARLKTELQTSGYSGSTQTNSVTETISPDLDGDGDV